MALFCYNYGYLNQCSTLAEETMKRAFEMMKRFTKSKMLLNFEESTFSLLFLFYVNQNIDRQGRLVRIYEQKTMKYHIEGYEMVKEQLIHIAKSSLNIWNVHLCIYNRMSFPIISISGFIFVLSV